MSTKYLIYGVAFLLLCGVGVHCQEQGEGRTFMTSCGNSSTLPDAYRYGGACQSVLKSWYYSNFPQSFWFNGGDSIMEYQNTTASWNQICRWASTTATCYEGLVPQCAVGIGIELLTDSRFYPRFGRWNQCEGGNSQSSTLDAFYRRTCDGTDVKQDIKERIDDTAYDVNTTCLNRTHRIEIQQCLRSLTEELRYDAGYNYQRSSAFRRSINRVAGATVNCIFSAINRSPCNQATKRVLYHVAKLQLPAFIDDADLEIDETTTGDFSSLIRCTVGVYGDPHLKLCEETGLVTCSASGNRIYITNDWFSVTGVNSIMQTSRRFNPPITTLRSVIITFYSFDSMDTVATYSASNSNLPVVFDNTNSTIQGQGDDEVILTENYYGTQRRFIQASTGMVLTLRQWSGNYFFTLRVSQSVIKKSHGLLASGCPSNELINRSGGSGVPARRKRATEAECEQACDVVKDPSFNEICKFDCYTTQDTDFAVNTTASAEEDVKMVVQLDSELISNAVTTPTPPATTQKTNSASPTYLSFGGILTAFLCLIFMQK